MILTKLSHQDACMSIEKRKAYEWIKLRFHIYGSIIFEINNFRIT